METSADKKLTESRLGFDTLRFSDKPTVGNGVPPSAKTVIYQSLL